MKEGLTPMFSQTKPTKKVPPYLHPSPPYFFLQGQTTTTTRGTKAREARTTNIRPGCYCIFKKLLYLCASSTIININKMLQSIAQTLKIHKPERTFKDVENGKR